MMKKNKKTWENHSVKKTEAPTFGSVIAVVIPERI